MSIEIEVELEFEIKELKESLELQATALKFKEWDLEKISKEIENLKQEIARIEHQIVVSEDTLDDMRERRRLNE